jgi:hypothetical protein
MEKKKSNLDSENKPIFIEILNEKKVYGHVLIYQVIGDLDKYLEKENEEDVVIHCELNGDPSNLEKIIANEIKKKRKKV